ncbi:hypothetical protein K7432_013026 [Basidiobolus ranarum]|uniref:Uncharacterized protein n=1 Tax=Basidiobolus ranarum TaxID=34480 RepID=A0ABR2VRZ3_9FUNG
MRNQILINFLLSTMLVICSQNIVQPFPITFVEVERMGIHKRDEEGTTSNSTETNGITNLVEEGATEYSINIGSVTISPLLIVAFVCGTIALLLLSIVICCVRARRARKKNIEKEVNSSCYMFEDISSPKPNLSTRGKHEVRYSELLDGEEGYSLSPQQNDGSTMNLLNSSADSDFSEAGDSYSESHEKKPKEGAWRLGELKLGSYHQTPQRRYLRDSYQVW